MSTEMATTLRQRPVKIIVIRHGITTPPLAATLAELTTSEVTLHCTHPIGEGESFLLLPSGDVTAEKRFEYTVIDSRRLGPDEQVLVGRFVRMRYQRVADGA